MIGGFPIGLYVLGGDFMNAQPALVATILIGGIIAMIGVYKDNGKLMIIGLAMMVAAVCLLYLT